MCDGDHQMTHLYQDFTSSEETEILKKMNPAQKLDAAQRLYDTARKLKAAGLKMLHPDWSEDEIQRAVREIFLYART